MRATKLCRSPASQTLLGCHRGARLFTGGGVAPWPALRTAPGSSCYIPHGISMGYDTCEIFHGKSMGFHGDSMGFHWVSMGFMWNTPWNVYTTWSKTCKNYHGVSTESLWSLINLDLCEGKSMDYLIVFHMESHGVAMENFAFISMKIPWSMKLGPQFCSIAQSVYWIWNTSLHPFLR